MSMARREGHKHKDIICRLELKISHLVERREYTTPLKFFSFSCSCREELAKVQNAIPLLELVPPSGKSWIRQWEHPTNSRDDHFNNNWLVKNLFWSFTMFIIAWKEHKSQVPNIMNDIKYERENDIPVTWARLVQNSFAKNSSVILTSIQSTALLRTQA